MIEAEPDAEPVGKRDLFLDRIGRLISSLSLSENLVGTRCLRFDVA